MSVGKYMEKSTLKVKGKEYNYYSIPQLMKEFPSVSKLPYSIKVLLEAAIRTFDEKAVTKEHIKKLATWNISKNVNEEVPFKPTRILLHDTTGLPAIVDLAAMRETMHRAGGDPALINPVIPVDLVVDHSVTVDHFGRPEALLLNEKINIERNKERFRFLRWAQQSFNNLQIVPPATGIMHQINMEYLSSVAAVQNTVEGTVVFPDSLVGTDSHTTMINGLGILAWGVGGIEAEAAMLGQPLYFVPPEVVGFQLKGTLNEGVTATDLALTITNLLRKENVVGKFVEFIGDGVKSMSVADRATIANMAPEYGATMGYFPVDGQTLNYLRLIGHEEAHVELVEAYYKQQGMFAENAAIADYSVLLELNLANVVPSLAGPKRPQDLVKLGDMKKEYREIIQKQVTEGGYGLSDQEVEKEIQLPLIDGTNSTLKNGSVVLAAITSCTNTSNPMVLIMAGILAKNAVEKGLTKPAYVKSSLTPGSRVVTDYLQEAGLLNYLEQLGFHVAGYGCATCIGNSGPLIEEVRDAIDQHNLTVAGVLSGNRNFEGRVHPQIKANYLASPPLVIAYALAGTVDIDFTSEPIGYDYAKQPVFLRDIWPSSSDVDALLIKALRPSMFKHRYKNILDVNKDWNQIEVKNSQLFDWEASSTYVQEPPFLQGLTENLADINDFKDIRILALLGDSVTTDHLSPSGAVPPSSVAGQYLQKNGVLKKDLNSYPSRRGNHHVMIRGALANHRIRNLMVPGVEGGYTKHLPTDEVLSMYDASKAYKRDNTSLFIIAGKEYGTGSSRDWAAKGVLLLGVKAVVAESFERIHRSNLVNMGVLPLQFLPGENAGTLGLDGTEVFQTIGLSNDIKPGQQIQITAVNNKHTVTFEVIVRLDNIVDIEYYRNGGIMQKVVRDRLLQSNSEEVKYGFK
ncbi:aconitate hydratase AcnA [Psychrobacillus sp. NPDC093180]|uniref:aconitate hydratase AcnA n=1 Tax=Psychrobacillus sp. NPDC093180 TaxID=3364489 RepID=UPI0037FEE2EF